MPDAVSALRSQMTVNVTGRLPKQHEPWPANAEEILLGSRTAPPTGFYTPPGELTPGSMSSSLSGPWGDVAAEYPYVANQTPPMVDLATPIGALKKLLGLGAYNPRLDVTMFTERPPGERVAHEAVHRLQMGNFPDRSAGAAAWNPRGPGDLAYLDAPGEQQAFKAEELMAKRRQRAGGR